MTTPRRQPVGSIEDDLRQFLRERTGAEWAPESDLFASGGLSSMFAMELVVHVEQRYGVVVAGADLRLDNFRSVAGMAALVKRLHEEVAVDG